MKLNLLLLAFFVFGAHAKVPGPKAIQMYKTCRGLCIKTLHEANPGKKKFRAKTIRNCVDGCCNGMRAELKDKCPCRVGESRKEIQPSCVLKCTGANAVFKGRAVEKKEKVSVEKKKFVIEAVIETPEMKPIEAIPAIIGNFNMNLQALKVETKKFNMPAAEIKADLLPTPEIQSEIVQIETKIQPLVLKAKSEEPSAGGRTVGRLGNINMIKGPTPDLMAIPAIKPQLTHISTGLVDMGLIDSEVDSSTGEPFKMQPILTIPDPIIVYI